MRSLEIESVQPYDHGYEWVTGTARFAVDPTAPGNDRIVDLALAPRDTDGTVAFDADVRLLRPVSGGNRKLLFSVANRGMLLGLPFSVNAPMAFSPLAVPHPGDGFLLQQGWTVAWCGWQFDVPAASGRIGLRAPLADVGTGWMRYEWRPDLLQTDHRLSDSNPLFDFDDYPTADVDDPDASLTARTAPDGERTTLPRSSWRFTDRTHVALDGGFQPFHWYELVYRTDHAPVAGTGLLAIRDFVSHLRPDYDHAFAYGISQSGRILRQLVHEGLNLDEAGNIVFDGMLSHIASSRLGEFNHRYAQPSLTHVIGFSNVPPYDTAGLFARQRRLGGVPKTFFTNTAWEYWRGDGALVHVDPETGADLPDDPDARNYLLAGTDHLGLMPMKDQMPAANPVHLLDTALVLRALFTALVRWTCDGVEPPPSQVPRTSDGTAVDRADVLRRFDHVLTPDVKVLNVTRTIDLGPDADKGIGRWPVQLGDPVVAMVSDVDEDGNEVAGIRLPAIAAPVAAFTGWNPRRPIDGLPDVLHEFLGSQLPFPPGRPSLAERYADRDAYAVAARRAADALVAGGFLLEADVDLAVDQALTIYDWLSA